MLDVIQSMDFAILNWIRLHMQNGVIDIVMPIITTLGNAGIIWIITAVVFMISKKYRKTGYKLGISLILCLLIGNLILKPWIARIRPFDVNTAIELLISKPLDFSFPSGHTMASFAAATIIFYDDKKIGICAWILAVLIAFSRLYLYVHYPSDVLAGAIIGSLISVFVIYMFKRINKISIK